MHHKLQLKIDYKQEAQKRAEAGLGSFQPFLDQAQASTGPQAFQQFMSPYQQQVIDTTLAEFDRRAESQEQRIRDQAVASGAFGGGREGVALAEFGAASDRDRAALQAQLLQQGFGQSQAAAQQNFMNQMGLASLALPGLQRGDISTLGSLGALNQAQAQASLDATREAKTNGCICYHKNNYNNTVIKLQVLMGGYGRIRNTNSICA